MAEILSLAGGVTAEMLVLDTARTPVGRHEGIRPDTSLERLAKLKPAFWEGGTVTAGNASQLSDGAAAVLVGDRPAADRLGVQPLARVAICIGVGQGLAVVLEA